MRVTSVLATIVLLCATGVAVADDGWWAFDAAGDWSAPSNWVGSIIADGADYTAYFTADISGNTRVTLDSPRTIGHLKLSDGGGSGSIWVLVEATSADTLTLSAPTGTPTVTASTMIVLSVPLAGSQGFRKLGLSQLTIHGADNTALSGDIIVEGGSLYFDAGDVLGDDATLIVQGGRYVYFFDDNETFGGLAGAGIVDLNGGIGITVGAGDQTTEFSGRITEHSGSGSVAKAGTGTLTLSGSNEHSGGTTLWDGALSVSTENNLGDAAGGLVFGGGTLQVTGTSFGSTSRTITWDTAGGGFDIADPNHTFTVSQDLTGSGYLTKLGLGTLSLTGNNGPYAGWILVYEGTLGAGINDSLGPNTGVYLASGTMLLMEGTEGWGRLSGAGEVDTAGYDIGLGHDGESTTFDGVISGAGLLAKHGAGVLTLWGANTYTGGTEVEDGALLLRGDNSAMAGTIHVLSGCSLYAGNDDSLSDQTNVTLDSGATLVLEGSEGWGSLAGDGHVELGAHGIHVGYDDTDTTFSGDITGTGGFAKAGAGAMTLSGSSDWTGGTTLLDGTLSVSADGNLGDPTGPLAFEGGNLRVTGTGFGTMSRSITVTSAAAVDVVDVTNTVAVDSDLAGSDDLTKLGDGTLALRGNNAAAYTGNITVSAGTLAVGISNSLGTPTRVTVEPGANLLIEADEEWGSLAGGGDVDLSTYYIRVGHDDTDTTVSGDITGTGVFRKGGAGTMTLSGSSDWTGGTFVDGGVLVAAANAALGSGPAYVYGGTLEVLEGVTISNDIFFDGAVGGTLAGSGTFASNISVGENGIVSPGSSAGVLTIDGDYTQEPLATLAIELGGTDPGSYDVLTVTGNANLAGTLEITLIDTFEPQPGDTFEIVAAAEVSGTFDTVDGADLPSGGTLAVIYSPTAVTLALCPLVATDLDGDCDVDLDDYATFESCLSGPDVPPGGGCEDSDFDQDNDVDLSDFGSLQRCHSGEGNPADPHCAD